MAVVLLLPGAGLPGSTYGRDKFGGIIYEPPNTYANIETYNSTISNSGATLAMNNLYDAIITRAGQDKIVMGHSRGGQVIYKLFRERLTDLVANVNPAEIKFISSGNPENLFAGASVVDTAGHPPVYPGPSGGPLHVGYGPPVSSGPFTLIDISFQYDEWSDHPADLSNTAAHNMTTALNNHGEYFNCPTLGLDGWPLNWDEWTYYLDPNSGIHYLWAPHFPHPNTPSQPASGFMAKMHSTIQSNWDKQYGYEDYMVRLPHERAFARPVQVKPPPRYNWLS